MSRRKNSMIMSKKQTGKSQNRALVSVVTSNHVVVVLLDCSQTYKSEVQFHMILTWIEKSCER